MNNTTRHKAYEIIKDKIVSLEFKPGDVLRESSLAEQLGLGRTPVREALLMLEQEKLVECKSNVGYQVRKLTRKEAEDYYALRRALEEFAAPMIIERITPAGIKQLKKALLESVECAKANDIRGVAACNTKFHAVLYRSTDSEAFVDVIFSTIDKISWLLAMAVTAKEGPTESLEDHQRIVKAIEQRNVEQLKKEIRIHLEHAQEKYLSMAAMLL
jgi:DNA-binding GntR family transcriptional regulator